MRKLTKTIATLEGLKSESSIGNVREIVSLVAKIIGAERAFKIHLADTEHFYGAEFNVVYNKALHKTVKLMAKNPDMTFDELVRRVTNRK